MGSGLFDSNYIEEEEKEDNFLSSAEEEENDNSQSEDNNSEVEFKRPFKKPKYNFYLNKSFLSSSSLKEDDKYKIKQMYAIKRINFIIKITRDFLDRKYHRKNSIEDQKDVLRKNPTFSNLKSKTALNTYNYENNEIEKISTKKNLFSYNNIVNKEINENEQKNIKLIRHTIYTS